MIKEHSDPVSLMSCRNLDSKLNHDRAEDFRVAASPVPSFLLSQISISFLNILLECA